MSATVGAGEANNRLKSTSKGLSLGASPFRAGRSEYEFEDKVMSGEDGMQCSASGGDSQGIDEASCVPSGAWFLPSPGVGHTSVASSKDSVSPS
jgi:hypothetical protein